MQTKFVERHGTEGRPENRALLSRLISEQIKIIEAFKSRGAPIIVVEYAGFGDTLPDLKKSVSGYPRALQLSKSVDSVFAPESPTAVSVGNFLKSANADVIVVIGANGSACVAASVSDALKSGKQVTVVRSGIADFDFDTFWYPFTFRTFDGFKELFDMGLKELDSLEGFEN